MQTALLLVTEHSEVVFQHSCHEYHSPLPALQSRGSSKVQFVVGGDWNVRPCTLDCSPALLGVLESLGVTSVARFSLV